MERCQLIDLVELDNPHFLRWWRRAEMWGAPFLERADRVLPKKLVTHRRRAVGHLKSRVGGWLKQRLAKPETPRPSPPRNIRSHAPLLEPGDRVRVKSAEAIQQTLDARGMCGGLHFMPVQYQYCGRTFRVVKQVRTFLDERDFRVKRLRRVVLLDGVYCDGSPLEPDPCDRMCFLFWKEAWLEKVDETGSNQASN